MVNDIKWQARLIIDEKEIGYPPTVVVDNNMGIMI